MRWRGAGVGLLRLNAPATDARAQRIRAAAVSGCSPYSCATRAPQPAAPKARMAAVTACRTCAALGSSQRCSADANSASALAAVLMLRG